MSTEPEQQTGDPPPPILDDPSILRYVVTDAATATYLVQQGIVMVNILGRAAEALKSQRQAIDAATRVTKAGGWPPWKLRQLARHKHEIPAKDGRPARTLEVVFVSGKVEAGR